MLESIKKYFSIISAGIQEFLAYRFEVFMFTVGELFFVAITYYLWTAVYNSSSTGLINGLTKQGMINYIALSMIVNTGLGLDIFWRIAEEVRHGVIAMRLIKPISYIRLNFFSTLGQTITYVIFGGIPLYLVLWFLLGANAPSLSGIGAFMLTVIFAYAISFFINFSLGLIAFHTTQVFGIGMAKNFIISFLSGALMPLDYYPGILKKIIDFLPFKYIVYIPTSYFSGIRGIENLPKDLGFLLLWVIILFGITKIMWHKGLKHLTILGG